MAPVQLRPSAGPQLLLKAYVCWMNPNPGRNWCSMRAQGAGKVDVFDDRCRWINETAMHERTGRSMSG